MSKKTANNTNTKSSTLALIGHRLSRRTWFMVAFLLVLFFILWLAHRPLFGMLGYVPSSSRSAIPTTTESFDANGSIKATPTGSTTTTVSGGASDRSSTNTNSTTTNTVERTTTGSPTSRPTVSNPTPGPASPAQPTQDRMPIFYASINGGQSKQQLISLAGFNPDKCSLLDLDGLGQQETCSWTSNNEAVNVTLLNNQVTAKTKVGF